MTVQPHFFNRAHSDSAQQPTLDYIVERYSRAAYGGPRSCTIQVAGDDRELWTLLDMLRNGVWIENQHGEVVWWGFINEVELTAVNPETPGSGRVKVGASLETMYNRVAIAYSLVDLGTGSVTRDTTAWVDDLTSQQEFGVKELLDSRGSATLVHAEAARDKTLADLKFPIVDITPDPGARHSRGVIHCLGWWATLSWKYYANALTNAVDTAEQVYDILTAKGQFFNSIYQDVSSGISISETRDGDATALYEAVELLNTGTNNFRRMLAEVDVGRNVRIYEEPVASTVGAYILDSAGNIKNYSGEPVERNTCPAAIWVVQGDLVPGSVSAIPLGDPMLKFIEEMEFDAINDRLKPTARNALDPWEFPMVKAG